MDSKNSKPNLTDFFTFASGTELPKVVAPICEKHDEIWNNTTEGQNTTSKTHAGNENELDYVTKHVEEERKRIHKIKLGNGDADKSLRNDGITQRNFNADFNYRGRGQQFRKQLKANTDAKPFSGRQSEPSIFGGASGTGNRSSETDVFLKYDFSKRMLDTSGLVINRVRGKIITHLMNNQIMMVEGFTGCGKTTQVPQFILDDAVANQATCRIVVTQPRRIAAISVANRVGAERNWKIGGIVGYQVGMDKRTSEDTRLTYMTTGVLLALLISRKSLEDWTHIIIDEVHERDLETDLLLLVIKKIMIDTANRSTKILLMSATLNAAKFSNYFPLWLNDKSKEKGCVSIIVDLPNQYPVSEFFLDDAAALFGFENIHMDGPEEPKLNTELFEMASKIIESMDLSEIDEAVKSNGICAKRGAVLVFLPGLLEIESLYKILTEINSSRSTDDRTNAPKWLILPLHSSITNEEQQRVFIPAKKGYRKIILATNIAESSITVPDIKYVIDFCLTKSLSCDPSTNYTCLRLEWASKNQCIQRRGRCGRVSSGVVYRMVTHKFYDSLDQETMPEMLRSSLESVVLQVKLLDMGSPESILAVAVDPPSKSLIGRAVSNLKEIGALTIQVGNKYDPYDGDLTFVGRVLSKLPIDIRLGRLILLGHAFDCLEEAVIIAAGLSVKTPFAYPYSKRLDAYLSKLTWASNSFSDCIAILNLYLGWYRRHQSRDFHGFFDEKLWARTYYVQLTSLREMKVLIDELYKRLKTCGIDLFPCNRKGEEQLLILKVVIAGAFFPNYFIKSRPNLREYQKEIAKDLAGHDPFSSVVFQGFPLEQPGELYTKVIGRAVAYQNCIPSVEFHGSKVVVTFDSRGDKLGPICCAVYRALKLRQLRHTVTFGTPSREEAYRLFNIAKMNTDVSRPNYVASPPQIRMPSLKLQKIQATITHIESPSEFFVIMKADESEMYRISHSLEKYRLSFLPLMPDLCEPGQLCIVHLRGKYFRGRVECERDDYDELMVYLIDRGMSMWIKRSLLFGISQEVLDDKLHLQPALVIQCRLSGIRASMRSGCVWCPESVVLFENYCAQLDNQVCIEIFSIVNCVISGVIRNSCDPNVLSINDLLKEKKYADTVVEGQALQDNHNIREKVQSDEQGEAETIFKTWDEKQNTHKVPLRLLETPELLKEPEQVAQLRGPHSPIEILFSSLCRSAHLKQAITDGSSVNSVALDQEPSSRSSRLLVAANVSVSARTGNILARETTVMPPIPGLCGLLAMMFCPKVELRVDEFSSTYTGCITGLGVDPVNGYSVYPDHDMEIVFDTTVDNHDINLINSVRSAINSILTDVATNREIRNLRDSMRKEALQLLERERKSKDEIWPDQTHQWNMIDPKRLVHSNKGRDTGAVFPLHAYVLFEEMHAGMEPATRNIYFMCSGPDAQG